MVQYFCKWLYSKIENVFVLLRDYTVMFIIFWQNSRIAASLKLGLFPILVGVFRFFFYTFLNNVGSLCYKRTKNNLLNPVFKCLLLATSLLVSSCQPSSHISFLTCYDIPYSKTHVLWNLNFFQPLEVFQIFTRFFSFLNVIQITKIDLFSFLFFFFLF